MKSRFAPARRLPAALATFLVAAGIAASLGSCAYYNTYYIARKFYGKATLGEPYRADRTDAADIASLNKAMEYSKKLLANYPKSKWVDDAYLLWAKAFLAKNDPLQTVAMLEDFSTRFPASPLKGEATFYRGVALRQARRYTEALVAFDQFLKDLPRRELLPYAYLERARTLRSLDRLPEAAEAAGIVVRRWPKSPLAITARIGRAEANLARGAFEEARVDFHFMGERSRTDDERLEYLLRESECLEAARRFDEALALLRGALGHERPPERPDTTGGRPLMIQQTPGYDRYGRLLTRVGTVDLMGGRTDQALEAYARVVDAYPRTPVSAEAQFRIGYAYEIGADDFEKARAEYGKVRDQNPSSPFVAQATQRQNTLDQLARYRSAGSDSADRISQGGFLLAEQYLFQLEKPERALAEYAKVTQAAPGSPWAGKAINAQAWVLRNRLDRGAEAESLYWKVVREYPATEAQLAARDYLEALGQKVPAELIKLPPPPAPVRDTVTSPRPASDLMRPLAPPPAGAMPLGTRGSPQSTDSLSRMVRARSLFGAAATADTSLGSTFPSPRDSLPGGRPPVSDDSRTRASLEPGAAGGLIEVRSAKPGVVAPDMRVAVVPVSVPAASAAGDTAAARVKPASAPPVPVQKGTPADTAMVRVPLPPIEFSPVRAGITYPLGPPRFLGAAPPRAEGWNSARASSAAASPVLGAPTPAGAGAPADSAGARAESEAARDSARARARPQGFQPRGADFQ